MPISLNSFEQKLIENISATNLNKIPGLTNWYDASDPYGNGSIPTNGTDINTWVDKSKYYNTMIAQRRGIYNKNSQNGLGTITFDSSWYKPLTANASYPLDVFVVVKLDSLNPAVILGTGSNSNVLFNYNGLTLSKNLSGYWSNDSYLNVSSAVANVSETSTSFLLIEWSIGNNNFFIYRNGVQIMYNNSFTWTQPTNPEFLIGRESLRLDGGFYGSIAEVVVFNNQLSTTYRKQVEKYLSSKWGIYYS